MFTVFRRRVSKSDGYWQCTSMIVYAFIGSLYGVKPHVECTGGAVFLTHTLTQFTYMCISMY